MELEQRTRQAVQALAPKAKKLLIAVSGGADSVALVCLLRNSSYTLELAHFDHALRANSAQDAEFVKSLAARLNLPFHSERVEVVRIAQEKKWNLEDAARKLRYAFLTRIAKHIQAGATLTAHTQDDQAETVLMQILRGAAYLKGMPAVQRRVIRPLLNESKHDLLEYLEQIQQPFVTDQTNFDASYTRAWLRNDILPQLETRYPALKVKLAQLAMLQEDQASYMKAQANPYVTNKSVDLKTLAKLAPALQRKVLVQLLEQSQLAPGLIHIEQLRTLTKTSTPKRLSLASNKEARAAYGVLKIVEPQALNTQVTQVYSPDQLPKDVNPDCLTQFPDLVLRSRRAGDRISLQGGSKKLKDLLIDKKIPQEDRDSLRVLASGRQVLWVEGVAANPEIMKMSKNDDAHFMKLALSEAQQAFEANELPVGAVIVQENKVIAAAHNLTESLSDPTAHAELLAIKQASQMVGDWRLRHCTLYVTLEPCSMCFGAIQQAHIGKLVYAASNHREGALGSVSNLNELAWKRKLSVKQGILEKSCADLLEQFFKDKR